MKVSKEKTKRLLRAVACLAMGVYLVAGFAGASKASDKSLCTGMKISVVDDGRKGFVTAAEVARELDGLPERVIGRQISSINTELLRNALKSIDKIEHVDVFHSTNGRINVVVTPLVPVARIFDATRSYYINREGKIISADARYHLDVPVIAGNFDADSTMSPADCLGIIAAINANPRWSGLTTMLKVDDRDNIFIIPAIKGHVINIGDGSNLDSKLRRVERMYRDVLPVKGWDYYDTLSVKWAGQVVATRRHRAVDNSLGAIDEDPDADDMSTMLTAEGVAPGQTRLGQKANSEKAIPAARRETKPSSPDSTQKKTPQQ